MSTSDAGVPRWAPDYSVTFRGAVGRFWHKYADFSGRASRAEYWWTYLFVALGYVVSLILLYGPLIASSISNDAPPPLFFVGIALTFGWFAATIVPWLALEARRLHDVNMSGLLLLLHLATQFGSVAVFVLCQLNSNPLGRRFDAPPGEAPRRGAIGNWPAAPGEPERPYAVRVYGDPPA